METDPMSEAETKTKPKAGFNAEEHRQLLVHHMTKLRSKAAEVAELREPLKAAQEEFTALVNEAKADLGKGYTRKYLMVLLEDATTRLRDLLQEEERRARDREALGLPVYGVQADLFGTEASATPSEARDEVQWEAEGFMRGRNGLLKEIPDGAPPRFHQAIMKGYALGQKATQDDLLAAAERIKSRGEPNASAQPENLNGDGGGGCAGDDDETSTAPEVVAAKAKKLKDSGFTQRAPANAEPQSAAA